MIVVDTNVLIYAADRSSEFYEPCRGFLTGRLDDPSPTYLSWNICYEFLRVTTHPRLFAKPWSNQDAWGFLGVILNCQSVSILEHTDRHKSLLAVTLEELSDVRGSLVHDLHTAVLMREHGISRICTRDTDFQRFPFLGIVDPLRV